MRSHMDVASLMARLKATRKRLRAGRDAWMRAMGEASMAGA